MVALRFKALSNCTLEESPQSREMEALAKFAVERVNELLAARDSLERHERHLQLLMEAADVNFDQTDPQLAVRTVLQRVMASLEMEAAELWVVNWESQLVRLVAYEGLFSWLFKQHTAVRFGEDLPGRAVATGAAVVSQDLQHDPRCLRQSVKDKGFHFYTAVPVCGEDQVVGVLALASLRPRLWAEEDSRVLERVAKVLGRSCMAQLLQLSVA